MKPTTAGRCQVCGKTCFFKCEECPDQPHVCLKTDKRSTSISCCMDLHDDAFFGLTMNDQSQYFGLPKSKFMKPTKTEKRKNKEHIMRLQKNKMMDDLIAESTDLN